MAEATRTTTRGAVHRELLADLLRDRPDATPRLFWSSLRDFAKANLSYTGGLFAEDPEWVTATKFVPDAHLIDKSERCVVVWEIVDTCDVTPQKWGKLADLAAALSEDEWSLILVRCDRNGRGVYDVFWANIIGHWQAPEDSRLYALDDWRKYDVQYCQRVMEEAQAAGQMSRGTS